MCTLACAGAPLVHVCGLRIIMFTGCVELCREKDKAASDVEATTGQVKQAQDVVPPMERLVHGLEQQQAETMK